MRLIEITYQSRRDFEGNYKCENCGNIDKYRGYDDRNYHDNVMPEIRCPKCKQSTNSLGLPHQYVATKYPEGFQI